MVPHGAAWWQPVPAIWGSAGFPSFASGLAKQGYAKVYVIPWNGQRMTFLASNALDDAKGPIDTVIASHMSAMCSPLTGWHDNGPPPPGRTLPSEFLRRDLKMAWLPLVALFTTLWLHVAPDDS